MIMIDFKFIESLEGFSCKGYVPDPENSSSGVTIACGFDLGQRSSVELDDAFSPELADLLKPYAGKRRLDAVNALEEKPLWVTQVQAEDIYRYSQKQAIERLNTQWNNADTARKFNELASSCQTVIASVAFQYGNLANRTPNFWAQVTSENWLAAINNLNDFGDKYPTRRKKEAKYLQEWYEHQ